MDITTLKQYKEHLKKPNKQDINDNIDDYTSDQDFREYFGKSIDEHIIKYSDLKNYRYITYLLKYDGDFRIILFEQEANTGHWCLLIRHNKTIEFFDPYGKPPLFSLTYSQDKNEQLDQYPQYLDNLLLNQDKFKVIYNTYPFQDEKDTSIATCGRHITLRLIMFKYKKYDLSQYINWFIKQKKKYKLSNDELVTHLIPLMNDKLSNIE